MVAQIDSLYLKSRPLKALKRLISYGLFEGRPLTTRGRWVNPLVFFLFSILQHVPRTRRVEKPVFIVGTGRSGTTLLGILLSMHKEVGYLNEPKALWYAIHPGEDIIGSYSDGDACYRLDASDADQRCVDSAHKLFGAYLRIIGATKVVDKYPELVFRVPFVRAIFPDAKFIFLTRNGYDTSASINKWSKHKGRSMGYETHDWWGKNGRKWKILIDQVAVGDPDLGPLVETLRYLTDHVVMATVEWILSMREGLAMRTLFPENVVMLRYEDLTADPRMKLTELLRFCDLQDDPVFMRYSIGKIRPSSGYKRYYLPDFLRSAFDRVMADLGYL